MGTWEFDADDFLSLVLDRTTLLFIARCTNCEGGPPGFRLVDKYYLCLGESSHKFI